MNERIRITVCAITAVIAVIMSAITVNSLRGEAAEVSTAEHHAAGGFVIREHGGRIAVFDVNAPEVPLTVTNINVASLRDSDRWLLSDGIRLSDETQVAQLLEDLGS